MRYRKLLLFLIAALLLLLPPFYLHTADRGGARNDPLAALDAYLRASYARDYKHAYRHISSEDRSLKDERSYVRERGAFTGFTLAVSQKLAESIRIEPLDRRIASDRADIKARLRVPDANRLSNIVLDWNFEELNALPFSLQKAILKEIDRLGKDGKLPMVEGEEAFSFVKESGGWKVFLDWASGVKLTFKAALPPSGPVDAELVQSEVIAKPGELFTISLQIKNTGKEDVLARIGHLVEPPEAGEHLDLVECGFLLPVRIPAGGSEEFSSTYLLAGGLPENVRHLSVTYDFKLDK